MLVNETVYHQLIATLKEKDVTLVAVSKTKPVEAIKALYNLGQWDFGENYVQELVDKQAQLPNDIRWHFIGHLQTNKVKSILPFVSLIHGVDSFKLLKEINKQAQKQKKIADVLLQVHIAREETKFGLDEQELDLIIGELNSLPMEHIRITGFMGMASFWDNKDQVRKEFRYLKTLFDKYAQYPSRNIQLKTLSMGMSGDYEIAIEEGSNLVRIGSLVFGARERKD